MKSIRIILILLLISFSTLALVKAFSSSEKQISKVAFVDGDKKVKSENDKTNCCQAEKESKTCSKTCPKDSKTCTKGSKSCKTECSTKCTKENTEQKSNCCKGKQNLE